MSQVKFLLSDALPLLKLADWVNKVTNSNIYLCYINEAGEAGVEINKNNKCVLKVEIYTDDEGDGVKLRFIPMNGNTYIMDFDENMAENEIRKYI